MEGPISDGRTVDAAGSPDRHGIERGEPVAFQEDQRRGGARYEAGRSGFGQCTSVDTGCREREDAASAGGAAGKAGSGERDRAGPETLAGAVTGEQHWSGQVGRVQY